MITKVGNDYLDRYKACAAYSGIEKRGSIEKDAGGPGMGIYGLNNTLAFLHGHLLNHPEDYQRFRKSGKFLETISDTDTPIDFSEGCVRQLARFLNWLDGEKVGLESVMYKDPHLARDLDTRHQLGLEKGLISRILKTTGYDPQDRIVQNTLNGMRGINYHAIKRGPLLQYPLYLLQRNFYPYLIDFDLMNVAHGKNLANAIRFGPLDMAKMSKRSKKMLHRLGHGDFIRAAESPDLNKVIRSDLDLLLPGAGEYIPTAEELLRPGLRGSDFKQKLAMLQALQNLNGKHPLITSLVNADSYLLDNLLAGNKKELEPFILKKEDIGSRIEETPGIGTRIADAIITPLKIVNDTFGVGQLLDCGDPRGLFSLQDIRETAHRLLEGKRKLSGARALNTTSANMFNKGLTGATLDPINHPIASALYTGWNDLKNNKLTTEPLMKDPKYLVPDAARALGEELRAMGIAEDAYSII